MKSYLPTLSVAHQLLWLRTHHPEGRGTIKQGKLTWRWVVQPTPISLVYQARLEYSINLGPEVYIESPDLKLAAQGKPLPHVYSEAKQKLCLYLPGSGEWSPNKLLSQTLVHWTSLWLNYYEQWLFTGKWQGGGEHPQLNKEASAKANTRRAA